MLQRFQGMGVSMGVECGLYSCPPRWEKDSVRDVRLCDCHKHQRTIHAWTPLAHEGRALMHVNEANAASDLEAHEDKGT